MQWKFLLSVMFFTTYCVLSVGGHGIWDPFGLRAHKSDSDTHDYTGEEDEEIESQKQPSIEFLPNPFPFNLDGKNRRGSGRSRGNSRKNPSRDQLEDGLPRGRSTGNRRKGEVPDEPNTSPCGPDNINCHGEDYVRELGLKWSPRVQNGTGIFIPDFNIPGKKRFLPIGIEQTNKTFGRCRTPDNKRGHCRHLEHCVLDDFKKDFIIFLKYQCDIPNQNYVGVCCPEQRQEGRTRRPNTSFPFLPFPSEDGFPPLTIPPFFGTTTTTKSPGRNIPPQPRDEFPTQRNPRRPKGCGISLIQEARIVGGRDADARSWPWMTALLKKTESMDHRVGQYCGGVLVSEFHIVTAAHCVDGFAVETLAVRVGEYDFSRLNASTNNDIDVVETFVHEDYNRYSYKNDIAVLKLAKSAFFEDRIVNICLPSSEIPDEDLINQKATVTGYGTIYYGGPTSDKLQQITVPIWALQDCKAAYTQPIEDTNLCAGVRAGSRDSCQGDSGGPLQFQMRGRWTTIGIVSWGIRCSEPGYPGVYTSVSKYIDWISKRMRF